MLKRVREPDKAPVLGLSTELSGKPAFSSEFMIGTELEMRGRTG